MALLNRPVKDSERQNSLISKQWEGYRGGWNINYFIITYKRTRKKLRLVVSAFLVSSSTFKQKAIIIMP